MSDFPVCEWCGGRTKKKGRRFCSVSCKMMWQQRNSEATRKAAKKNLAAANVHPKSISARRKTMRKVVTSFNKQRKEDPEVERKLQKSATAGKLKSKKFRESASRCMTEVNKRPEIRELRSKHATERAIKHGITSYRKSIPVRYKDRFGELHKMRSITEVKYAIHLDLQSLSWEYQPCSLEVIKDGESRKYIPDFWVGEWNCYVEIKGYKTKHVEGYYKRIAMYNSVNLKVIVLDDFDSVEISGVEAGDLVSFSDFQQGEGPYL